MMLSVVPHYRVVACRKGVSILPANVIVFSKDVIGLADHIVVLVEREANLSGDVAVFAKEVIVFSKDLIG
ncbi:hypothetical protein [Sphingobacterium haloxyli]|uniref:Uncharacterized protein n=1 Tax=Sphingobacterium haloxyli TaxID=2100533 RepID=A0A2S9J5X7_9SPHI|nr:hypothetical protein [Sphingobacterium haloxyli]PRD48182.1 hypothetical protein C5745_06650 [Sphingobacterium haloxyli]